MKATKLAIVLFLTILFSRYLYSMKPLRDYPSTPSDFGILYREVTFETEDGLYLKGWLYPAQDTAGISNDLIGRMMVVPESLKQESKEYNYSGEPQPTIIMCDGDAGNMAFSMFYAYHYFTRGYTVFTFDWRGFGESDTWDISEDDLCCTEFLIDYAAAIDFAKEQPEVASGKIGLMGFSTGAYLSFAMIAARDDISAYIGRALTSSFDDLVAHLQKVTPDRTFVAPQGYPENLLPIHAADEVITPVFLIVGEKDDRTPVWMSEAVYEKLKGPKELWIVPEAEHGGQKGPEMITYPDFFVRTLSFYDKYLK
ncbi:prolyl oligopeptidase family serine peptidase [candidate division WOR-3 bacterium]|nr:prolyl oligopeptidase family serine peptidase [candidate division WOR-3 bacterium]